MTKSSRTIRSAIGRRAVLQATGLALAGGVLASGSVAGHGGTLAGSGDSVSIGNGSASAYTEREHGQLSAVGVRFGADALTGLPERPAGLPPEVPYGVEYHLDLPGGDTGRFEYVGMDYNPTGHEPPFFYGHPHFDFHFYMLDEETVAGIPPIFPPDTVPYDVPDALMPAGTGYAPPRAVVPAMGEHLFSIPASLPFGDSSYDPGNPAPDGWSVYIWGAYDPDGDEVGQLTFMEPMITVAYLNQVKANADPDNEVVSSIPMPERFLKAGWYPTEYVVRYHSEDDEFTVSLESFEQFSGYGRR